MSDNSLRPRMAMRFIDWFFNFIIGRAIVRERSLPRHCEMIRIHLKENECPEHDRLPKSVLIAVVQEAYRRAAESEPDKLARYGPHHVQLKYLSLQIAAALKRETSADPRIKNILEWNHVI